MKGEELNIELPSDFGKTEGRIACIFNADVKEFIAKFEQYDGSYIDKRFWQSTFWKNIKAEFSN